MPQETTENSLADFAALQPDTIIDAVESLGLNSDARIFPLNSYENRVYQIGIENQAPVIGKFYRPQRWTDAQIREEHRFTLALQQLDIPVIAPCTYDDESLLHYRQYRYAIYPRVGGRAPELDNADHLKRLGRFLGRIHALGCSQPYRDRPVMDLQSYVIQPSSFILQQHFIADYLQDAYRSLISDITRLLQQRLQYVDYQSLRIHGDCHPGNILWTDGPMFVDFDDSRMGPAIQDLWMLLSGDQEDQRQQLDHLLEGYFEFGDFNMAELALIEPLRTLRIIHYSGWLAQRWQDPSFPLNFPWFNTPAYWERHILELREQYALLQENEHLHL
ncbi:MAG: serine/threonine protein kinase [Gammaproteobacteria bacterium]|nr:MAG: serine/threonine protein kinase [Gammaproteobacteria bacterium]